MLKEEVNLGNGRRDQISLWPLTFLNVPKLSWNYPDLLKLLLSVDC